MRQKGFVAIFYILLILVVIVLLAGFFFLKYKSLNKEISSIKKTSEAISNQDSVNNNNGDSDFRNIYSDLNKETNTKDFKNLYDKYLNRAQKGDVSQDQFVATIEDFFNITQLTKVNYELNNVLKKDTVALVNRTIEYCFDKDCNNKKSEKSEVKWYWENNRWTTKTEFPTCLRDQNKSNNEDSKNDPREINEAGIIITPSINCDILPIYWYIGLDKNKIEDLSDMVKAINDEDFGRATNAIRSGLKKYPAKFLNSNLTIVYILGDLNFYGVKFGSTYSYTKIYLTGGPIAQGYTNEYIEGKLHHEFSSILLNKYRNLFKESNWIEANPQDFVYGRGGANAIKNNQSSEIVDKELLPKGFLNSYAQATLEEDFNEFAQFLFLGDKEIWNYANTYPRIKSKLDLFINFYQTIEPSFTEDFFRSL